MDWVREWWGVIAFGIAGALTVLGWAIRKGLASKEDLEKVEKALLSKLTTTNSEMATLGSRTLLIENELKHLPSSDDISELRAEISGLSGKMSGVAQEQSAQRATLSRIEDHLLANRGRA
ncbi:DUF2730 family protein [Oleomonas cavernae]|nr:DUF2730 family protein [Oleomonas cavernae]